MDLITVTLHVVTAVLNKKCSLNIFFRLVKHFLLMKASDRDRNVKGNRCWLCLI